MNRIFIWPITTLLVAVVIGCSKTNQVGSYVYVTEINLGTRTMMVKSNDKLYLSSNGTYTMNTSTQTWSGSYTISGNRMTFSPALDGSSGITKGLIENGNITLIKVGMRTTPGKFVKQ